MKDLIAAIQALITQLQQAKVNAGAAAGEAIAAPAEPMATGGVVYASEGQPIFSPKGHGYRSCNVNSRRVCR